MCVLALPESRARPRAASPREQDLHGADNFDLLSKTDTVATMDLPRRAWLMGTTGLAVQLGVGRAEAASLTPLSEAERRWLTSIPADPHPERLASDQHFLVSDESFPERFRKPIEGLGGAYVGVGSEQNYLYAGWSRPTLLLLVDFDELVVELHRIYRAFFLRAATPAAMLKLWSRGRSEEAVEAIRQTIPQPEEALALYRKARQVVHARLQVMARRFRAKGLSTFLDDQAQYDHIRALMEAHRVHMVRGDLSKDGAMPGIAKAVRKLGETVRCLYLSNVEFYVPFANGIGENCRIQPTDDRSLIMRTVVRRTADFERYLYCVQSADDFRAWLKTDVDTIDALMQRAGPRVRMRDGCYVIPAPA